MESQDRRWYILRALAGAHMTRSGDQVMVHRRSLRVLEWVLISFVGILSGCATGSIEAPVFQIAPKEAILMPGQTLQFNAVVYVSSVPQLVWQVNGAVGGSSSTGTITMNGLYTAPQTPTTAPIQIGIQGQAVQAKVVIFDSNRPTPGTVQATENPLVAAYTITVPLGASVQVQFGTDTSYGRSTSAVSSPSSGGIATVLVAGMYANTTYHMRAAVTLADGSHYMDADHAFTTGTVPADILPNITTQLTGAGTPSPGVELLSLFGDQQNSLRALATDLNGNVVWYYDLPTGDLPFPLKLLPNGHMLMVTFGAENDVREFDLAGKIIHQVTLNQLNQSLAKVASFQADNLNHAVLLLPNGHLILLASITKTVNGVSGVPDGTKVTGNALIDWDPRQGAVWTWSTFDHLDLSRAPYGISDWTHGNALVYSPDDGDLLFSMRNQNLIVKINYKDGAGDGSILWRFGPGGDFALPNQDDPIEWNYGQHDISIESPNSSGIFSLMFFNNGNDRLVDANSDVCGSSGVTACYSSVPIFQVNEYSKTATPLWEDTLGPAYSTCCGDARILGNSDVEYDIAHDVNNSGVSVIEEVTQTQTPQLIWKLTVNGQLAYRGFRIPSLYPGQVWPANFK